MGQYPWPESHSEQTDVLPTIVMSAPRFDGPDPEDGPRSRRSLRRTAIVGGAVVGVLGLLYAVDLMLSSGDVPRGVTVAGVDIGGLSRVEAEQKLHREIEPRLTPIEPSIRGVRSILTSCGCSSC